MSTSLDPATSIEGFAELSARLSDPFLNRDSVLRSAGLDAARWQALEQRWAERFVGADAQSLAKRFSQVYDETRQRLATSTESEAAPHAVRGTGLGFLTAHAQPWRAEAADVGHVVGEPPPLCKTASIARASSEVLHASDALPAILRGSLPAPAHPLAGTADADLRLVRPALPFASALEPRAEAAREGVEDPAVDKTLDAPEGLPRPALPFVPRETSSSGLGNTLPAGTVLPRPDRTPRQS